MQIDNCQFAFCNLQSDENLETTEAPQIITVDLALPLEVKSHPRFERPLSAGVREARLLNDPPWTRSLGKLTMEVATEGWRFPVPPDCRGVPPQQPQARPQLFRPQASPPPALPLQEAEQPAFKKCTRLRPSAET